MTIPNLLNKLIETSWKSQSIKTKKMPIQQNLKKTNFNLILKF
ncbi:hypothetical protein pah_c045o135 [Parachlamydia acanthamoebae str. Hall's coccus]|nr:hypothetical protein pah_c045o135 [Parachlamydia acanthamoebae str. Hall's coccus]